MAQRGRYSWQEITTQAESWQGALNAVGAQREALAGWLARCAGRRLFFTGCGSTHYLALYAAPFFQQMTGQICRGVPSSELVWQTGTLLAPGEAPGVVALSRSGETSETILAVDKLMQGGSPSLTVSCYDASPLAQATDLAVGIPEGREESFAQTGSFAGMLVAVQALASLAAGDEALWSELETLPAQAEAIIERAKPTAQLYGQDESIQRITYLGSGALYGLASEATVKMKEMSLSLAEPYPFMEFRHGPMSLVDGEHLVVALVSDAMRAYEVAVLRDLKARGARILAIANGTDGMEDVAEAVFDLNTPLPERSCAVLYLPMVQLMAYYRAMGRGLDPDRPRNVVMAIRLEGTEMEDYEQ